MAKTELKLKSKNVATGQDITTTLSYVNPNADSATLKTFGQKLNAFTTNNYVETDRVHTINVDTEQIPGENEITLSSTTLTKSNNSIRIPINTISLKYGNPSTAVFVGVIYNTYSEPDNASEWHGLATTVLNAQKVVATKSITGTISTSWTLVLTVLGTDEYPAGTLVTPVTIAE